MSLLKVINLSKQHSNGLHINNINFEQQQFKKLAIAGESGAGKTTLLKIISGYVQPNLGKILFNGKAVVGPNEKLLPGHNEIAYLSQHYELLNNYKVEDLIWFENKLPKTESTELFEVCQISHLLQRKTDQLSGGEKQRIALCMLLVKSPKLLLLDEPFSNLDLIHKQTLKKVLANITNKLQITCTLASHDPQDILSWADEILVMNNGQIIQQGTPQQIYYEPINEYVAGLFGKYNLITAEQVKRLFNNINLPHNKNHILIRPEQICITPTDNAHCIASIINISFWGSYYQVELKIDDLNLTINVLSKKNEIGDVVGLEINNQVLFVAKDI